MPTPSGSIVFALKKYEINGVSGMVTLPKGMVGMFVWDGKTIKLREGEQGIMLGDDWK